MTPFMEYIYKMKDLNPNKARLFEDSFFWGEVNLTPLHISRIAYPISI